MTVQSIRPLPALAEDSAATARADAAFELSVGLSEFVRNLASEEAAEAELMSVLLSRCVDAIGGAEAASVTERLATTKPARTAAASGPDAAAIDLMQYATGQGPCLQALGSVELVRVDDLVSDCRWPEFQSVVAANSRFRSVLSVPIPSPDADGRSLNLYAGSAAAFDRTEAAMAYLIATAVGVALRAVAERERANHLQTALSSNRQIGAAMGIIMAGHKCSADDAFDALRRTSQNSHRKLREVADEVVFTGALPEVTRGRPRPTPQA